MKHFFRVLLLGVFALNFAACQSPGKGKIVLTLEPNRAHVSADESEKIKDILKKRLGQSGIAEKDIDISQEGNRFVLKISETSHYPAALRQKVMKLVQGRGQLELWETYTLIEIAPKFPDFTKKEKNDSLYGPNARERFSQLVGFNPELESAAASCELGLVRLKDTSAVMGILDSMQAKTIFPADLHFAWSNPEIRSNKEAFSHLLLLKNYENAGPRIANPVLKTMELVNDKKPEQVFFQASGADADAWLRMTKANTKKTIAIAIDGLVYSWPRVNAPIPGGGFSIVGPHQPGDYEALLPLLYTGALPVPLNIVEMRTED